MVTALTEDSDMIRLRKERKLPYWQLAADILQLGFDRYKAFEEGKERNGFATDRHFYAMLCNNLGIALSRLGRDDLAWPIHESGFNASPFHENAINTAYSALYSHNPSGAARGNALLQQFVQKHKRFLGMDDMQRAAALDLGCFGLACQSVDEWLAKRETFHQEWGWMRQQSRFCNSDEHYLPNDWSFIRDQHNYAINDEWRALQYLHSRFPDDPRVLNLMLRNRRDHAASDARREGLALASEVERVLAPRRHTAEGAQHWFESRYSLAYLRYRSWFYDADLVGQEFLPQAHQEFKAIFPEYETLRNDPNHIDAMLDYSMMLVREDLDLDGGIVWLGRVIDALEPQPRAPAQRSAWDPKTAADPALALAYVFRAHAYCMQDQNDKARADLLEAGALNPWMPAVWYWMATIESESGNVRAAIDMANRFVGYDGSNPPDDEERAIMLDVLIRMHHMEGENDQAQARLEALETLDPDYEELPELQALFHPSKQSGKSVWSTVKGWFR